MLRNIFLFIIALAFVSNANASSSRINYTDEILSADGTMRWTLPSSSMTLVGRSSTETLTNKTIDYNSNTILNLPVGGSSGQEVPSGSVNGSNTTFTLSQTPTANKAVSFYLDGLLLRQGAGLDYTISGASVTIYTAPSAGQKPFVIYTY